MKLLFEQPSKGLNRMPVPQEHGTICWPSRKIPEIDQYFLLTSSQRMKLQLSGEKNTYIPYWIDPWRPTQRVLLESRPRMPPRLRPRRSRKEQSTNTLSDWPPWPTSLGSRIVCLIAGTLLSQAGVTLMLTLSTLLIG